MFSAPCRDRVSAPND